MAGTALYRVRGHPSIEPAAEGCVFFDTSFKEVRARLDLFRDVGDMALEAFEERSSVHDAMDEWGELRTGAEFVGPAKVGRFVVLPKVEALAREAMAMYQAEGFVMTADGEQVEPDHPQSPLVLAGLV